MIYPDMFKAYDSSSKMSAGWMPVNTSPCLSTICFFALELDPEETEGIPKYSVINRFLQLSFFATQLLYVSL